jgi:hypothetical protein
MLKINILYTVTKKKTNIKGFWKDEKGKLHIDNIIIKNYSNYRKLQLNLKELFIGIYWLDDDGNISKSGEKAVFYTFNDVLAYIEDNRGNKTILLKHDVITYYHINKGIVKTLLNKYNGFTCFKEGKVYKIELWY